jgi:hypothetical protein
MLIISEDIMPEVNKSMKEKVYLLNNLKIVKLILFKYL